MLSKCSKIKLPTKYIQGRTPVPQSELEVTKWSWRKVEICLQYYV